MSQYINERIINFNGSKEQWNTELSSELSKKGQTLHIFHQSRCLLSEHLIS